MWILGIFTCSNLALLRSENLSLHAGEGNNASRIMRKILKIRSEPQSDDGIKLLQISFIDNPVQFFKQWR